MNKKIIVVLLIIVLVIGCLLLRPKQSFKKEYEKLNGKKDDNGKTYLSLNIYDDDPFVYADYEQIFDVLDDTGVIYFGVSDDHLSRNIVSILLDAADETGIGEIYYLDISKDRDYKKLEKNKVVTKKEGTKDYKKLLKLLGDRASVYKNLNDETIKRVYLPTVVFVKGGKIVDYMTEIYEYDEGSYVKLSKQQRKSIQQEYENMMSKILICNPDPEENC